MSTESPAWRTSSHSSATGDCVEVAPLADKVLLRHSKHPDAGTIAFPHPDWAAFVGAARADRPGRVGATAAVDRVGVGTVVRSTDVTLRFDYGEWSAFRAGVADGEFDFPR